MEDFGLPEAANAYTIPCHLQRPHPRIFHNYYGHSKQITGTGVGTIWMVWNHDGTSYTLWRTTYMWGEFCCTMFSATPPPPPLMHGTPDTTLTTTTPHPIPRIPLHIWQPPFPYFHHDYGSLNWDVIILVHRPRVPFILQCASPIFLIFQCRIYWRCLLLGVGKTLLYIWWCRNLKIWRKPL